MKKVIVKLENFSKSYGDKEITAGNVYTNRERTYSGYVYRYN